MTTTTLTAPPTRTRAATMAGVWFLVAAAAAIAGLALYDAVLNDPRYVLDAGRADTATLLGACFEVVTVVAVIGTATALYPLVRRHGESLAISYVVGRAFEATMIAVGLMSLLAIVALRRDAPVAGADDAALIASAKSLVALHDATFLVGPGLAIGINTTLLATLMHRSRLVPRAIARIGLAGGPVVFASSLAVLFGAYEQTSAFAGLGALLVFVWEMALAVRLLTAGVAQPAA